MIKLKTLLLASLILFGSSIITTNAFGANKNFTNYVGLVEVRTGVWGSFLIITILDSNGARVKLCDAAPDPTAIALSLSDPSSSNVQAIALSAKLTGKKVTGWGLDQTQGSWCVIGNFAIP